MILQSIVNPNNLGTELADISGNDYKKIVSRRFQMKLDLLDDIPEPLERPAPSEQVPQVADVVGKSLAKIGAFGQLDLKQQVRRTLC